ncbi:hypothetical protein BpHYR1_032669 [Brachionus plicatilis]|uniref:Uncharacterized protein n=1 Tax=Brachionus plicatilis TaxID=10195 RepID=A0A3M7PSH0_BRAPC|nr:hypothetical protein BpHYR1_032669 [Brachionus plicatilis]
MKKNSRRYAEVEVAIMQKGCFNDDIHHIYLKNKYLRTLSCSLVPLGILLCRFRNLLYFQIKFVKYKHKNIIWSAKDMLTKTFCFIFLNSINESASYNRFRSIDDFSNFRFHKLVKNPMAKVFYLKLEFFLKSKPTLSIELDLICEHMFLRKDK